MSDSERYKSSRTYRHTATTVLCCTGCCSDDWISILEEAMDLLSDRILNE